MKGVTSNRLGAFRVRSNERGVFAQSLSFIERKQSYRSHFRVDERSAHHRAFLVSNQLRQMRGRCDKSFHSCGLLCFFHIMPPSSISTRLYAPLGHDIVSRKKLSSRASTSWGRARSSVSKHPAGTSTVC